MCSPAESYVHPLRAPAVAENARFRRALLFLLFSVFILPACGREAMGPAVSTAIARSSGAFPYKDKFVLVLENRWGRIRLQSQAELRERLLWQIDKSVASTNPRLADEALDKIRLSFTTRRDTLIASVAVADTTGIASISADLLLHLPPALQCLLLPTFAPTIAFDLRAPLRLLALGDSLLVIGHRSDLVVDAGTGSIDAHVALRPQATCSLSLSRGNISLHVPGTTEASIHLSAPNGTIRYANLPLTVIEQSTGRLVAVLGRASATIDLRTENGDIVLSGEE